jgi:hypothetical protein
MNPSFSRAFQRYQEHNVKPPNLVDLIVTKQNKAYEIKISQCNCLEQLVPQMQPSRIVWQSSSKDHQFFIIPCVIIKLSGKLTLSFIFFIFLLSFFPYQFPTWCPSLIVQDRRDCNCNLECFLFFTFKG